MSIYPMFFNRRKVNEMRASHIVAILLLLSSFLSVGQQVIQATPIVSEAVPPMKQGVVIYYTGNQFQTGVDAQEIIDQESFWTYEQEVIHRRLTQMQMMGVNSICLAFPIFTNGWQSTNVFAHPEHTPSVEQLAYIVQTAHELDMTVMLKPQLDEKNIRNTSDPSQWRGTLKLDAKRHASEWFSQLTALLLQYTLHDQPVQPDWLAIGSELNSLETKPYQAEWQKLLTTLHLKVPSVQYTYAQSWEQAYHQVFPEWFGLLDGYTIDAYFPLEGLPDLPSAKQIATELDAYRFIPQAFNQRFGNKEVFLTEVGVASMGRIPEGQSVFEAPWQSGSDEQGLPDMLVQQYYIEGACLAYQQWHADGLLSGMYVGRVNLYPPHYPLDDNTHDISNKPAQVAVRICYTE